MQMPFLLLSYENFATSKKLFSYEKEGVHTLPIFTDASKAVKFAKKMTHLLKTEFHDSRVLHTQLCSDAKKALQMFETIAVYSPDLMRIVIDPQPPTRDDEEEFLTDMTDLELVPNYQDIDDVIEQLQDVVGLLTDVEKGEPESKAEYDTSSS